MIFVSFEQNRFLLWDKEAFLYIKKLCYFPAAETYTNSN